jgi:hypothetical protein
MPSIASHFHLVDHTGAAPRSLLSVRIAFVRGMGIAR